MARMIITHPHVETKRRRRRKEVTQQLTSVHHPFIPQLQMHPCSCVVFVLYLYCICTASLLYLFVCHPYLPPLQMHTCRFSVLINAEANLLCSALLKPKLIFLPDTEELPSLAFQCHRLLSACWPPICVCTVCFEEKVRMMPAKLGAWLARVSTQLLSQKAKFKKKKKLYHNENDLKLFVEAVSDLEM